MRNLSFLLVFILVLLACRKEPRPLPSEISRVEPEPTAVLRGMYLVNEGNMNMNKASLDYLDFRNGIYTRNFYNQINPEVTKGLGDVGNDIGIYGSKLYIVVNVSNKVEVLNVRTGKRIGQINITNGRYLAFAKGRAYVSAYLGRVGDPTAVNGIVAEVDTTTLSISRTVRVGRQPEEMAIVNNKLYVANSGGYSPPNYENTISVVDLDSFMETKRIEAAINLHRLKADKYGDLYVTSRGDYYDILSKLLVIDTKTEKIKKTFDFAASNLTIDDEVAYIYATSWNYLQGRNTINYFMIDVKEELLLKQQFITDGSDKHIRVPYGIAVNPYNKDIYITDARDYVTPGKLHCYNVEGHLKWSVTTGDIPAHLVFVK
ncbi:YncE family protein [Pedobacter sp. ASV28]|uniref:YncE family protein n=1 Tax=Pedobacter sp. ASV28 TaxID=2795123 RepID=UPI0018EB559D|nr:DUF5074 domain-containing protein [Pedobacter sp. ASV28]